ncbi:MAG TPA: biopolymer transporter ExbD [Candidatus Krumholzibacteria bacterium]|nr:biopolymer transporter ExbD [Candidatus Krumholzibacteria bacterium]
MYARRSSRHIVDGNLELMPLMNVFVALIPMLLLSAVFIKLAVIDLSAPPEAQSEAANDAPALALAVTIKEGYFVVEGDRIESRVIARTSDNAKQQLGDALAEIATQFPANHDIMIISQANTRYEDIVAVMDISRDAGLPGVSLLGAE